MDLFGDLPEPASNKGSITESDPRVPSPQDGVSACDRDDVSAAEKSTTCEKRKLDMSSCGTSCTRAKSSVRYKLKGYVAERKGERENMQDAHFVVEDYTSMFTDLDPSVCRLAAYGIFDGHAGARASRFASENLHKNLRDKFPKGDVVQIEKEIRKSFIEAFKKTDEDFLKEATKNKPAWKDGTTGLVVLALNDTLYIANLGDSQAILCRFLDNPSRSIPVSLSAPHNPTLYEERVRIQKAGGHVKDGRVMGVLEVSRSIGDGRLKNHGVSCVPDIKKCQLTDNDRYIILACDGLWKSFTSEQSIEFINKTLQDSRAEGGDDDEVIYDMACSKLASEAVRRLSADNVTVLLVSVKTMR